MCNLHYYPPRQRILLAIVNFIVTVNFPFTSLGSFSCLHSLVTSPVTSAINQPPALCSHSHTKHSRAATLRGRELKRPFDCFFYLCMQEKATSLALGDLQIETFSLSEVQMSEMMQESSN